MEYIQQFYPGPKISNGNPATFGSTSRQCPVIPEETIDAIDFLTMQCWVMIHIVLSHEIEWHPDGTEIGCRSAGFRGIGRAGRQILVRCGIRGLRGMLGTWPMDWFKGQSTWTHHIYHIYHQIWGVSGVSCTGNWDRRKLEDFPGGFWNPLGWSWPFVAPWPMSGLVDDEATKAASASELLRLASTFSILGVAWWMKALCNPQFLSLLPITKTPPTKKNRIGAALPFFFWLGTIGFLIVVIENQ